MGYKLEYKRPKRRRDEMGANDDIPSVEYQRVCKNTECEHYGKVYEDEGIAGNPD